MTASIGAVAAIRRAVEAVGGNVRSGDDTSDRLRLVGAHRSRASSGRGGPRDPVAKAGRRRSDRRRGARRDCAAGRSSASAPASSKCWSELGGTSPKKGHPTIGVRKQLQEAISIRPGRRQGLGLARIPRKHRNGICKSKNSGTCFKEAQHAAARALALDPRDPYALSRCSSFRARHWTGRLGTTAPADHCDRAHEPSGDWRDRPLTQAAGLNREVVELERAGDRARALFLRLSQQARLEAVDRGHAPQADKVIDQVPRAVSEPIRGPVGAIPYICHDGPTTRGSGRR